MKLLPILVLILIPLISYSQVERLSGEPNYSISATAQLGFGTPSVGVSGIMEERVVTFQGHLLLDANAEIRLNIKMGFTLMEEKSARLVVYPLWLNANVSGQRFFTPIGISYLRVFEGKKIGTLVLNVGTEFYLVSDEMPDRFGLNGEKTFALNASVNYLLFGNRYKK